MPIANVSAGNVIDPSWGNDVANALNGLMTPAAWSVTSVGQPGPVSCTTTYGFRAAVGDLFVAHIKLAFTAAGVAGSPIQFNTPYTLANLEAIGGVFSYYEAGNTVYTGTVWPVSTTVMGFQVNLNGSQFGVSPSFAIASGDAMYATCIGRRA